MWVSADQWTNQVNGVYPTKPKGWADSARIWVEVPDDSTDTVNTPSVVIPLVDALWSRSGAFSIIDGVLVHDESWVTPEI